MRLPPAKAPSPCAPIGVFDSGVGGLSVLRSLLGTLPGESFVYLADSGHAPYGERDDAHVLSRAQIITEHLTQRHGIKALVVACNTATAAAIQTLRERWPDLLIVGMEPPLKPATAVTRTGVVGVVATRGTLDSEKFAGLLARTSTGTRFILQACDGLADAIERHDAPKIKALCTQYTGAMGSFGSSAGDMDVLVLGCTHYPFAAQFLRACVGSNVILLDAGEPVARRAQQLLAESHLYHPDSPAPDQLTCITTGDPDSLRAALARWLPEANASVTRLALDPA